MKFLVWFSKVSAIPLGVIALTLIVGPWINNYPEKIQNLKAQHPTATVGCIERVNGNAVILHGDSRIIWLKAAPPLEQGDVVAINGLEVLGIIQRD